MKTNHVRVLTRRLVATALAVVAGAALLQSRAGAQQPPAGAPPANTAQGRARLDLTGVWVSVVTEDWRWRMLTPPKGDLSSIPVTVEAQRAADGWDPAKDTAEGNACRGYGAAGVMRLPGRLRIGWQDGNTLKVETDAGQQTRLFRFADNLQVPTGESEWQGFSTARWLLPGGGDAPRPGGTPVGPAVGGFGGGGAVGALGTGGLLLVETTHMKPGYMRKNGVPYSADAKLIERFYVLTTPDGNRWLTVNEILQDPKFLVGDYVTSYHFKREPNDSKFSPTPCSAD